MMKRTVVTLSILATLSGCQQVQTYSMGPFPENEYAALNKSGTGTITGQVFLKTRGGDVKYGAGEEVKLVPKTSYATEFYSAGMSGKNITNFNEKMRSFSTSVQADGSGHFIFKNVAAGNYYIQSKVLWTYGNNLQTGGVITKEITIHDGEAVDMILTSQ